MTSFKKSFSFDRRLEESKRIVLKYPNRVPIIVENSTSSTLPVLEKKKYLPPSDITIGQFIYILRKRLILRPEQAIFLFINNSLAPTNMLLSEIYSKEKDFDGFLYAFLYEENAFGSN